MNTIKDNVNKVIATTMKPNYINTLEHLAESQAIGRTIETLLEAQEIDGFFNAPVASAANANPWNNSMPLLKLKFDQQTSCDLASFNEIKQLACVGLPDDDPKNIIYAQIEFHDSLAPESEPFYIACTVHLGALIGSEEEAELEPFDLLRHATYLQCDSSLKGRRGKVVPFIYRGKPFAYKLVDSRLEVMDEHGLVIIAGDGE